MEKQYSVCIENDGYECSCIYANNVEVVNEEIVSKGPESPYIETEVTLKVKFKTYNSEYGDDKLCKCGHIYYRHFDSYEGMAPVGCKYCQCDEFVLKEDT